MRTQYSIFLEHESQNLVGTLWLNSIRGHVTSTFAYAPRWLEAAEAFALSPDLPLDGTTRACNGLFGCLQDCCPDRWGTMLLQRLERRTAAAEGRTPRTLQAADCLLRLCDCTRQGALRLSDDGGRSFLGRSDSVSIPSLAVLPGLVRAARHVCEQREEEDDRDEAASLQFLAWAGASLGGARPKVSVLGAKGELCIAKLSRSDDERDMPLWEYVTYRLAQRAGLNTPEVRLQRCNGTSVLLVRRFDRLYVGRKIAGRIPFLSAMSLLQAADGDHASYVDLAAALQTAGSAPDIDLPELWARMVFNMCVCNVDDHLRNHGFLHDGTGWRLAPVYDLETAHPGEKPPRLHTALIDEECDFNVPLALDLAEFFCLRTSEAQQRLAGIRKAVASWREEAVRVNARAAEMQLMREAYENSL